MSDLFKGLENLGFNVDQEIDLFANDKPEKKAAKALAPEQIVIDRHVTCPICGKGFTSPSLRTSKLRFVKTDSDLRPYYEPLDPLYYDVTMCPDCGYTTMNSSFKKVTEKQEELIKTKITPNFKRKVYPRIHSADDAIERYTFALLNAYIKGSKNSEKAYLCLKLAWIYRDKGDNENELKFLKNALAGFNEAYQSETFPIAGMDEDTMTFLLGELNRRCGNFDEALKHISRIIVSTNVNQRLKNRASDIKEAIREEKKRMGAQ